MSGRDLERVAALLGSEVVRAAPVDAGGYSPARRLRVELADGRVAFVKIADQRAAALVEREHRVYSQVVAAYLPALLGYEGGSEPLLAVEFVAGQSGPPLSEAQAERFWSSVHELGQTPAPPGLPVLAAQASGQPFWRGVADDGVLWKLGWFDEAWMQRSVDALVAAELRVDRRGGALVHQDLFLQNWCIAGERVAIFDWADAGCGSPLVDRAFALMDLRLAAFELGGAGERAVPAWDAPDEDAWSAWLAGQCAAWVIEDWDAKPAALRATQLRELRAALDWAVEANGLEPPKARADAIDPGPWEP